MTIPDAIDSRDLLLRLIRRWPWLLAAICLGGFLGLGISRALPPVYEAVAVVGVGVDYGRTLPLDDDAMRLAQERVRVLLLADETLEAVLQAEASAVTLPEGTGELRDALRLSQIDGGWQLGARSGDAEEAARWANAWATVSVAALQTAGEHAWRAAELQSQWFSAGCELVPAEAAPALAAWSCAESQAEPSAEQALGAIEEEAVLSHGILPSMSFAALQDAEPPARPLTGPATLSILAGLIAGAVVGVAAASASYERGPRRRSSGRKG